MLHSISRPAAGLMLAALLLAGCGGENKVRPTTPAPKKKDDAITAERDELNPKDRKLVEEQEFCVVQQKQHLGAMGPPIKEMVKGKPVFVCCEHCLDKVRKDPDGTLKKVEALKTKVKAAKKEKE